MAKGQKRSSREVKKPKQPKKPAVPASPFGVSSAKTPGLRAQEKEIAGAGSEVPGTGLATNIAR